MFDQTQTDSTIPGTLQQPPYVVADHRHNGTDAPKIRYNDIAQKKIYFSYTIPGTSAATASNYGVIMIVPAIGYVTSFKEVHQALGTDAGAVTLGLEKLTGTAVPGAGTDILSSALSLKSTINTVQTGTITTTAASRNLAVGDRLALKLTGTPTAVSNVTVLLEITLA